MFEKFKDPKFLEEYRHSDKYKDVRDAYLEHYNKYNKELKSLLFSKFREFSEKGTRGAYEAMWNDHIHKLHSLAYMTIFMGDSYLYDLEDSIYDILSAYVWALPAHVPDINEENYYELDLGSTSTACTLALIHYLLKDKLHPQLEKRIRTELRRRILEPFKNQIWHWEDRYNNWTSVCAGFTGITLMLMFPDEFDKLIDRFDLNMEKYYRGFPDDGVCLEGPGYWGYGFVSFLAYAYVLREYSNGKHDYFKLEKTKKIALFYQNTMLDENVITSYGDAPMDVKTNASLLYLLKSVYGDEFIMPTKVRHALPVDPLIHILMYIEHYNPDYKFTSLPKEEIYMESAGWYVRRYDKYAFGAKGGSNGESHNHNDVGSFVLSKNDKQVLIDIGVRPYTREYFTEGRYDRYMEISSKSHNVPIINGKYQANLPCTRSYTKLENGVFTVDFKELYDVEGLTKLTRHYKSDENGITITDEFEGVSSFEERLVSYDEPKIVDGVAVIDSVSVIFDSSKASVEVSTDYHVASINDDGTPNETKLVYYLTIKVNNPLDNSFSFRIEC